MLEGEGGWWSHDGSLRKGEMEGRPGENVYRRKKQGLFSESEDKMCDA